LRFPFTIDGKNWETTFSTDESAERDFKRDVEEDAESTCTTDDNN
jgi:hypothetical protein